MLYYIYIYTCVSSLAASFVASSGLEVRRSPIVEECPKKKRKKRLPGRLPFCLAGFLNLVATGNLHPSPHIQDGWQEAATGNGHLARVRFDCKTLLRKEGSCCSPKCT